MAEERGLAPAGVPGVEHVQAEELEQRDRGRRDAPEHERAEEDDEIVAAAHEQRDRHREERVLAELRERHEVARELVVVDRGGPQRPEGEPHQERRAEDPEPARPQERGSAESHGRHDRRDDDEKHGEIGGPDVDGRRADVDAERPPALMLLVEEDEGDRRSEDDRAEARPVREESGDAPQRRCGRELGGRVRHAEDYRNSPRSPGSAGGSPARPWLTLTPRCPLASSGAGRRRLRGSTPPLRSGSSARSSPRASSPSRSSASS